MTIIEKTKNFLFSDKNKAYTFLFAGISLLVISFLKAVGIMALLKFLGIEGIFLIVGVILTFIGVMHGVIYGWDGRYKRDKI